MEPNKLGMSKNREYYCSLHAISTPSGPHLHTRYGSMHDVKMVTALARALAWRLENLPWGIQIPRDKKPRGEADRCCKRWAQHGRKQGSISQRGCNLSTWKSAENSIPSLVIVFTPRNGVGIENRASKRYESSISHLSRWAK